MYTKEQASKLRQQFWTRFGQYMKPVPGSNGNAVNWINYKTGVRHIAFRMNAENQKAIIAIELNHAAEEDRMQCYGQFISLKKMLENETGFVWDWEESLIKHNGETISIISQTLHDVNVLNESDWPAIIAFFKPRIIALDAFWGMAKDGFQ